MCGANGVALESDCSIDFVCDSVPTVIACSAELFKNSINNYSSVAFQFSAPMSEETLKKYCTITCKKTTSENVEYTEITPIFEMIGNERLWTVSAIAKKAEKWSDSTDTDKYEYTITIGKDVCSTNGTPLGKDYVVTFKTK